MKAIIDITSKCNLRCRHCYNFNKYFSNHVDELSDNQMIKLIEWLANRNCTEINILGGEPLCRNNIIDVLRLAKNKSIFVTMTTNGTLISEKQYEVIFKESLLDNLIISLDGPTAEINDYIRGDGVFNKVMHSLKVIKELRERYKSTIYVSISYCVCEKSISDSFRNLIDICKEAMVNWISFFPMLEAGGAVNNSLYNKEIIDKAHEFIENNILYAQDVYPELIFSIEERPLVADYFNIKYKNFSICPSRHSRCGVLNKCIYIKADGKILPCGFVEFEKGLEEQRRGTFNIDDALTVDNVTSIANLYKGKLYQDFLQGFYKYSNKPKDKLCDNCLYKNKCQPCPYQNKNGEIYAECRSIYPKFENILLISREWQVKKKFDGKLMDELFCGAAESAIGTLFDNQEGTPSYREFLNNLISYEKKQLIKIERGSK